MLNILFNKNKPLHFKMEINHILDMSHIGGSHLHSSDIMFNTASVDHTPHINFNGAGSEHGGCGQATITIPATHHVDINLSGSGCIANVPNQGLVPFNQQGGIGLNWHMNF